MFFKHTFNIFSWNLWIFIKIFKKFMNFCKNYSRNSWIHIHVFNERKKRVQEIHECIFMFSVNTKIGVQWIDIWCSMNVHFIFMKILIGFQWIQWFFRIIFIEQFLIFIEFLIPVQVFSAHSWMKLGYSWIWKKTRCHG